MPDFTIRVHGAKPHSRVGPKAYTQSHAVSEGEMRHGEVVTHVANKRAVTEAGKQMLARFNAESRRKAN